MLTTYGCLQVFGAAAQDFVTKPSWETYGWAYFTTPAKPADSDATKVNVQVCICGDAVPGCYLDACGLKPDK